MLQEPYVAVVHFVRFPGNRHVRFVLDPALIIHQVAARLDIVGRIHAVRCTFGDVNDPVKAIVVITFIRPADLSPLWAVWWDGKFETLAPAIGVMRPWRHSKREHGHSDDRQADVTAPTVIASCCQRGVAPTKKPVFKSWDVVPPFEEAMHTTAATVKAVSIAEARIGD